MTGGGVDLPSGVDNGSFDSFVREHCSRLVQTLSLVTLDRESASDAAQDAFLRLYLRWDSVGELHDPVAWLYTEVFDRLAPYSVSVQLVAVDQVSEGTGSPRMLAARASLR